jgi:ribosome-associated translation inhibitor RaiA
MSEREKTQSGGRRAVLDEALHLSGAFSEADRSRVLDALSALGPHLSRWTPPGMRVEASVKDRAGKEQTVTLRAELPGYPTLVAKGAQRNLDSALSEAKRELIRQLEDEKKKRDPKNNRHLRNKTS